MPFPATSAAYPAPPLLNLHDPDLLPLMPNRILPIRRPMPNNLPLPILRLDPHPHLPEMRGKMQLMSGPDQMPQLQLRFLLRLQQQLPGYLRLLNRIDRNVCQFNHSQLLKLQQLMQKLPSGVDLLHLVLSRTGFLQQYMSVLMSNRIFCQQCLSVHPMPVPLLELFKRCR